MQLPEHLTIKEGYARFCPEGQTTLEEGVALVAGAIEFCTEQRISKLLVDITRLTGIRVPTIVDRAWLAREWAEKARGMLIIAIVAPPALIDARKFGVTAAHNMGLRSDVFTTSAAALEWLLGDKAKED